MQTLSACLAAAGASRGITSGIPEESKGLFWMYVGAVVVITLVLFYLFIIMLTKRKKSSGLDLNLDTGFLDGIKKKNTLTKEEMLKVREAMVSKALQQQEKRKKGTSVNDLTLMAATGDATLMPTATASDEDDDADPLLTRNTKPQTAKEPSEAHSAQTTEEEKAAPGYKTFVATDSKSTEEHPDEPKREVRLADLIVPTAPCADPPPNAEAQPEAPKATGVDIEALYERGLIDREEYERLRNLASQVDSEWT